MAVRKFMRSIVSIASLVAAAGCSGGSGSTPVAPARAQTYALSAGVVVLPNSNGYRCTMSVPANDAAAGGTIRVTMPPPGTNVNVYAPGEVGVAPPSFYSVTYPNPAQIVALTNVPVTFQGVPYATCALIGSASAPVGFIDPGDPGAIYGPSIVVTTGARGAPVVTVPAGVSFPLGTV